MQQEDAMKESHQKNRKGPQEPKEREGSEAGRVGKSFAMTGAQLSHAVRQGDAATVRTLLSMPGPQSFINYQDAFG